MLLLALVLVVGCTPVVQHDAAVAPRQLLPDPSVVIPADREVMVMVPLADGAALEAVTADLSAEYPVTVVALWPMVAIDLYCIVFEVDDDLETAAVMADLAADPRVSIAQPMNLFDTRQSHQGDPLLDLQSGLAAIGARAAHEVVTGAGVRVAVIDTGVDRTHPDLVAQLDLVNDFTTQGRGVPPERHGTAIAGIIAAEAGNGVGIVGVAPAARLMGLRGCWELDDGRGRCSSFTLARALNFSILNGADVINLSLGGPYDPVMERLIETAIDRGASVVAALEPASDGNFPATARGVLGVRPAGSVGEAPADSVTGPARQILSTAVDGGFGFFDGASVATAHVSGLVALLREAAPEATPAQLKAALIDAPDDLNACTAIRHLVDLGLGGPDAVGCPPMSG